MLNENEKLKARVQLLQDVLHQQTCKDTSVHKEAYEVAHEVVNHIINKTFTQIAANNRREKLKLYRSGYSEQNIFGMKPDFQTQTFSPTSEVVRWIPDHYVSSCTNCRQPFGFFKRKHHCRYFRSENFNLASLTNLLFFFKKQSDTENVVESFVGSARVITTKYLAILPLFEFVTNVICH